MLNPIKFAELCALNSGFKAHLSGSKDERCRKLVGTLLQILKYVTRRKLDLNLGVARERLTLGRLSLRK